MRQPPKIMMTLIYYPPEVIKEREELWIGSITVAILLPCQDMKILYYNCININIVG